LEEPGDNCPLGVLKCDILIDSLRHDSPKEFTNPIEVTNGSNVLLQTVFAVDNFFLKFVMQKRVDQLGKTLSGYTILPSNA
jgi:hypothetical protein